MTAAASSANESVCCSGAWGSSSKLAWATSLAPSAVRHHCRAFTRPVCGVKVLGAPCSPAGRRLRSACRPAPHRGQLTARRSNAGNKIIMSCSKVAPVGLAYGIVAGFRPCRYASPSLVRRHRHIQQSLTAAGRQTRVLCGVYVPDNQHRVRWSAFHAFQISATATTATTVQHPAQQPVPGCTAVGVLSLSSVWQRPLGRAWQPQQRFSTAASAHSRAFPHRSTGEEHTALPLAQ